MRPNDVAELARREGELWEAGRAAPARRRPTSSGAYVPLGATTDNSAGTASAQVEYVSHTASGTQLIFAFRWPEDPDRRLLLLVFDFNRAGASLVGAGTWLLEYIEQHVHHDTSWYPDRVSDVAPSVAVVETVRQPGQPLPEDPRRS